MKETGITQTLLVVVLLGLLGVFIVYGLAIAPGTGTFGFDSPEGPMGVLRASAFVFVVYLGGESIAVAQAEIKNPGKTIPRAILLTSVILILVYTTIAFIVFKVAELESLEAAAGPLAYVAEKMMGPAGLGVVMIAGIIAALSSVNTSIMAHSRVAYALARDGYFPKRLFSLHGRFSTPHLAVVIGSIFTAAFAATGVVNFVAYATDFGFIIGFIFVNLSMIKLRRDKPNLARPFKVPLYPLTPILGIGTSLLLIVLLEPGTLFIGAQLFIFGLIAYYVRMVGHNRAYLALGGINFGLSAFSALLALLVGSDSLPITLAANMAWLVVGAAALVSVTCLAAGVLCITGKSVD